MAERRSQWEYRDDGTVAQLTTADTTLKESQLIVPVDIQSRFATTIQTHSSVMITPSGNNSSAYIDCDGFNEVAFTLRNDAVTASFGNVQWSNDGTTVHGEDSNAIPSSTPQVKSANVSVKARYVRLQLNNGDTGAAHTMSAWAYLKS